MPSFGGRRKLVAPHHKILWYVKEPCGVWQRHHISQIQGNFSLTTCFAARYVCCNHRALDDESGMIRNKMETHKRSENGCSASDALTHLLTHNSNQ
jgi:hypothetical protein